MRRTTSTRALLAFAVGALTVVAAGPTAATATGVAFTPCSGTVPAGHARCMTIIERSAAVTDDTPDGLGADALRAAYSVPTRTSTTTVAVSIWHNAPNLEHDLDVYRRQYGLGRCTTNGGCLRIVNQKGSRAPLPADDPDVALETTLDVSMISAACPGCRILVVESEHNSSSSLAAGERTAVRLGATVVSNSYGATESGIDAKYRGAYEHAGVVTVASTGDSGFNDIETPASYPGVVAVGGTTLARASTTTRGWTEQAWTYGSSGCSAYSAKSAWQRDRLCAHRLTADISAAADNIAMHYSDAGGWITIGGTSASAPFVAGLYGLAGNSTTALPVDLYTHRSSFHDITSGTNDTLEGGRACGRDALCVAGRGYDAPTGLGTPAGISGL